VIEPSNATGGTVVSLVAVTSVLAAVVSVTAVWLVVVPDWDALVDVVLPPDPHPDRIETHNRPTTITTSSKISILLVFMRFPPRSFLRAEFAVTTGSAKSPLVSPASVPTYANDFDRTAASPPAGL
jgi:hypothetical protein